MTTICMLLKIYIGMIVWRLKMKNNKKKTFIDFADISKQPVHLQNAG